MDVRLRCHRTFVAQIAAIFLGVALGIGACSGASEGPGEVDAGRDDAGGGAEDALALPDAEGDAAPDAPFDAAPDAPFDAAPDVPSDAASDVGETDGRSDVEQDGASDTTDDSSVPDGSDAIDGSDVHDIDAPDARVDGANPTDVEPDVNLPPVVVATVAPSLGCAPMAVTVDASASTDEDGEIVAWEWAFGDGSTADTAVAVHDYDMPGDYTVRVTVTDDRGASTSREVGRVRVFSTAAGQRTWVGLDSTQPTSWFAASNWCPSGPPTATDRVVIPGGLDAYPSVTSNATVADLHIEGGGALTSSAGFTVLGDLDVAAVGLITLSAGWLEVGGDVVVDGSTDGGGMLRHVGTGGTVRGSIARYEVMSGAAVAANGPLDVHNFFRISGELAPQGHTVQAHGPLVIGFSGTLLMVDEDDEVIAHDDMTMQGTAGGADRHSAGVIRFRGSRFDVGTSNVALNGTGTHRFVVEGTEPQVLRSLQGNNRFGTLEINNPEGVTLSGAFHVTDDVVMTSGQIVSEGLTTDALVVEGTVRGRGEDFAIRRVTFTGSPDLPARLGALETRLQGVTELGRDVHLHGDLQLQSPGGQLVVWIHHLTVDGRFETSGTGRLYMTHSAGEVTVHGASQFGGLGPAEDGPLGADDTMTQGIFRSHGDVTTSLDLSGAGRRYFYATEGHRLVLAGDDLQRLRMSSGSRIAHLEGVGAGGLEIQDNLTVFGDFDMYVNLVLSGSFTVGGNMYSSADLQRNDGTLRIFGTHVVLLDSEFTHNGTSYLVGALDVRGVFRTESGRTARVLGNLETHGSAVVHNAGELRYGGDFVDTGATFHGNPPVLE
jgi:PKD repeat protein